MIETEEPLEQSNAQLNYVQTGRLLTEMGYLPLNMPSEGVERDLLFDLWNQLEGENRNGVSSNNLKTLLLAVSGINNNQQALSGAGIEFDTDGNLAIPQN